MQDYITENSVFLEHQDLRLTYWDVNFNNILVDKDYKITALLDFENVEVASIDYVLRLVRDLSRLPHRYVDKSEYKFVDRRDYSQVLNWYQEFYPELFAFPDLKNRLDIYQFYDDLLLIRDFPNNRHLRRRLHYILLSSKK